MMTTNAGISQLERLFLAIPFFALIYVLLFFAMSRLGFVHGRHLLAFAGASPIAWCFLRWVLPPPAILARLDRYTISSGLLITGFAGTVLFVVTAPGYVLVGHDPIIIPTLANGLLSHSTTMEIYQPGDHGFTYPPGYPILFSAISRLLTPLSSLFVFKVGTIILVLLLPVGWVWMAQRVFHVSLPAWLMLLLSYIAVFGLERTATFTLQIGKNAQVLAGAIFPFLAGLLLISTRTNIGVPFAIAALVGAILIYYSAFYMVATFFVAYFLIHFPRERKDWMDALRLALTGLISLGIFVLLMREALNDPRAGSFGWPDPVNGLWRMAHVLLDRYDQLLFIFHNSVMMPSVLPSPYRGLFLLGCMLLPLATVYLQRKSDERSFAVARMAGVFGIMWLIGIAFGTGVINIGITDDFTRWYLIFPQAALILSALCAVACYARSDERGTKVAYGALGGIAVLGVLFASADFAQIARAYRAQPVERADLTNVRDVLTAAAPCFLITQSTTFLGDFMTMQRYRPLDYAEMLTGCWIVNGSFVHRGIPEGRAMDGLPTAAALATLPPGAAIFLIVPEPIEAAYRSALPNVEFVRQQTQIGPLPVWRIRLVSNPK
ncbi:MAG: hypothetical protein E7813_03260 [Bradyrhizobium sp.]|uniref:hypothetical protein n=1 Tax=Bradyrhizobium sp. TaxID=376 RepID=UPI00121FA117|nr:hypothetical protein [Bradyrhizobium sp.]THD73149.1 MAG: hypothetical protein E7813_03260 [Bradyrhizobium sp.]